MVRYFQNHISRLIAFVVAVQILNMSIDSPSAQMQVVKNSTDDFNYVDTYIEYIAEVILKYDNAIPESKHRQQKELQQHKQLEIVFENIYPLLNFSWKHNLTEHARVYSDKYPYQFIKEINPPPPKA